MPGQLHGESDRNHGTGIGFCQFPVGGGQPLIHSGLVETPRGRTKLGNARIILAIGPSLLNHNFRLRRFGPDIGDQFIRPRLVIFIKRRTMAGLLNRDHIPVFEGQQLFDVAAPLDHFLFRIAAPDIDLIGLTGRIVGVFLNGFDILPVGFERTTADIRAGQSQTVAWNGVDDLRKIFSHANRKAVADH
ncbi:hypothetical protein SDC9_185648 [bioreactor metagenome]|uniref:Uncharacterized protein n=1 Tax=bioreactor metagenome TaxID=1076179 RepID=A0A645HPS4_9ZZZZ